jgi:hypothetical protein
MSFTANSNSISITQNVGANSYTTFDTSYRMPHIISSISGTFNSTDAAITLSSSGCFLATSADRIVSTSANYTFSNSFAWAWVKITNNANRTDVMIDNPIFITGSILLRFYIGNNSLRGSYILTPMVFSGGIGFREEWQYANPFQTLDAPAGLYATDVANTNGNMGLTFSYTLYYGRFI